MTLGKEAIWRWEWTRCIYTRRAGGTKGQVVFEGSQKVVFWPVLKPHGGYPEGPMAMERGLVWPGASEEMQPLAGTSYRHWNRRTDVLAFPFPCLLGSSRCFPWALPAMRPLARQSGKEVKAGGWASEQPPSWSAPWAFGQDEISEFWPC